MSSLHYQVNCESRQNQKQFYNIVFQSAWQTLEVFSQDPKHKLQARMGMISVLHTWTQKLVYHPHIHCIVPAGGFTKAGYWKHTKSEGKYLFPDKALARVFRGKVMEKVIQLYKTGQLEFKRQIESLKNKSEFWQLKSKLYDKPWVVYAKAPFDNSDQIVEYLARYTHKIAISNQRILSVDENTVTFSYLDRKDNKIKTLTLAGEKFIARFLSHVLPKGYSKIRHYGIFATRVKGIILSQIKEQLGVKQTERKKYNTREVILITKGIDIHLCSECKQGQLVIIAESGVDQEDHPNYPKDARRILFIFKIKRLKTECRIPMCTL